MLINQLETDEIVYGMTTPSAVEVSPQGLEENKVQSRCE